MGLFFDARPQSELHEPMTSKDCKWSHQPSTHTRNPVRRCSVFSVKFWYGRASENHSPSLESCKQMYMIHFGFEVNWVPHLQTKKTLFWVIHQLGLIWLLVMVPKTRSCHIRKSPKPPQSPDFDDPKKLHTCQDAAASSQQGWRPLPSRIHQHATVTPPNAKRLSGSGYLEKLHQFPWTLIRHDKTYNISAKAGSQLLLFTTNQCIDQYCRARRRRKFQKVE